MTNGKKYDTIIKIGIGSTHTRRCKKRDKMVKIIADSTCDLSPELKERYDIDILPLGILMDDKSVRDGELTQEELFSWADSAGKTPKTAAPSLEEATELFCRYRDREVIAFSISSEMSTSNNVMRLAAKEAGCERVKIVDSRNLSTGIGLQILYAADMAAAGEPFDAICAALDEVSPRVRASFVIDTLTYLQRGGRCSPLTALAANLLSLKPMIVVEGGKMDVSRKYRGKIGRVVGSYVEDLMPALKDAERRRVFVTHTMQGEAQSIVEETKKKLEELGIFEEVLETRAGGVISSHCGPNTLGVLFIAGK